MVGIGGSGMSSLAKILHEQGHIVSGCDNGHSPFIEQLKKEGIPIYEKHSCKHITKETEQIIYTPAIAMDNPDIAEGKRLQISQTGYSQAVGDLTNKIPTIAVCGTHGKTTTTAMTFLALSSGNFQPGIIIGSPIKQLNGLNGRYGAGRVLVLEACEYKRNFLNYHPEIILITNIEKDHLDYFKDEEDYRSSFMEFCGNCALKGTIILNGDDPGCCWLLEKLKKLKKKSVTIISFGKNAKNDFHVKDNVVFKHGIPMVKLDQLDVPGEHNRMNALGAYVAAVTFGTRPEKAVKGIMNFKGTSRRFEFVGNLKTCHIYDDYAHHPSEIKATLQAAREKFPHAKILAVFQPHQYSRTIALKEEFSHAFKLADHVAITDIYAARDSAEQMQKINGEELASVVSKNKSAEYVRFDNLETFMSKSSSSFDLIITMGAGDIWQKAHNLFRIPAVF